MTGEELLLLLDADVSKTDAVMLRDVHAPGVDLRGRSLVGITFEGCDLSGGLFSLWSLMVAYLDGYHIRCATPERGSIEEAPGA
jgi:uncharacterized protein YjbI with pentapeptide repeats